MNKPVYKIQAGTVAVALWENDITSNAGRTITVLKATLERRYRDSDGNWKSSTSFARNEIPFAKYCLEKAFEYMIENSPTSGDPEAQRSLK